MRMTNATNPRIAEFLEDLNARREGFQDIGQAAHPSALQEVEQEREVEVQVEAVRVVKKPSHYKPRSFPGLHKDLERFATTGHLPAGTDYFMPVFSVLARTALGKKYKVRQGIRESRLFVTAEQEATVVKFVSELSMDNTNFTRPAQWLLYSMEPECAAVITPEEAEALIPILRQKMQPTTLITYAAPVTRRMFHFNDMKFYSIPSLPDSWTAPVWLKVDLGFFAGRLYFEWEEYGAICQLLGIDSSSSAYEGDSAPEDSTEDMTGTDAEKWDLGLDGTSDAHGSKPSQTRRLETGGITLKPYTFTQEYLGVLRRGQDVSHTPMGYVCMGKPLHAEHSFFRKDQRATRARRGLRYFATRRTGEEDDEGADSEGDDGAAEETEMAIGEYAPGSELKEGTGHEIEIEYGEDERFVDEDESADGDKKKQPQAGKVGRQQESSLVGTSSLGPSRTLNKKRG